jgi:disulfide bond formation protein DsbB
MRVLTASRWPWFALAASLAMLAAAHAFQQLGGLAPCMLCLKQRDVHWGAAALAAAALVFARRKPGPARLAALMLGLVFLASAAVAAYHVAVEQKWVIAQCEAADLSAITTLGESGSVSMPACDEVAWSMFGISMAGYNALVSLVLAALSFTAARRA